MAMIDDGLSIRAIPAVHCMCVHVYEDNATLFNVISLLTVLVHLFNYFCAGNQQPMESYTLIST